MLSFLKHQPDKQPVKTISRLNNIRFTLNQNLDRSILFWQNMNWAVKGEHILVSMLLDINTQANTPIEVYSSVRDFIYRIASARGFVTPVSYGRIQPRSDFYGKECQEIYIEQPFDDAVNQMFTKHYTQWESLRVVRHPFTSLDYQLANGKIRGSGEKGLCILKMDLALMYAQYWCWRRDPQRCFYMDGTPKSIMNFIHSYPIPHLLKSHTDQAWFNRLFHLNNGIEMSKVREDGKLHMVDPYHNVDDVLERIIQDCEKSRNNFHTWCSEIPGIFCKNLKAFYTQDDILETHQLRGVWDLGRYPLYEFLFGLESRAQTRSNTLYRNEYLKRLKEYTNNRTFGTIRGLDEKTTLKEWDDHVTVFANLL